MSRVGILGPCSEPLAGWSATLQVVGCGGCGAQDGQQRAEGHARAHCRQAYHGRAARSQSTDHTVANHGGGVDDASNAQFKIIAAEPDGWSRRGPRQRQALCTNWPASAAPSGSGAQGGEPPILPPSPPRQQCQVAGSGPPVFAAARGGGAQAQISVVKRWWGPQIPGPIHFTDVQQLDYPLYRHVPPEQPHPSKPTRGTLSTYLLEPANGKRKKKGTCS